MQESRDAAGGERVKYKTEANPKAMAGEIPVFCAHDEIVLLEKLVPNPKNPNEHPSDQVELLAKIIKATGWRQPITVSKRSGFVVKGHGRLMAAIRGGLTCAPVDYQEYATDAEEYADLVADNRLAELSEMNNEKLREIFEEVDFSETSIDLTGYTEEDLTSLFDEGEEEDEDEEIEGEVKFTEVLREEHNYIVLYFDNEVDWLQAQSIFNLKTVRGLSTRPDGKITAGNDKKGIGRVLNGANALEELRNAYIGELSVVQATEGEDA